MGLLLFATILGAIAGFAGWALCEPFAPGNAGAAAWSSFQIFFSIILGCLIGGAIGGLNGHNQGSRVHMLRGIGLGALLGGLGGFLGFQFGGSVASVVINNSSISEAPYPLNAIGRSIAFAFFGAGIGSALGASSLSLRRAWIGALGGACGGVLAGLLFDPIATVLAPLMIGVRGGVVIAQGGQQTINAEVGGPSRAILGAIMGGSIGLFTSWFLLMSRQAWVRLVLGRNEGREWLLDRSENTIGRSESAHIPLFGDPNVAPNHAMIRREGAQYVLYDAGTPLGIGVNGQRVQKLALFDNASIQIGTHTLVFMMKAGAARRAAEAARASGVSQQASPQQPGYAAVNHVPQSGNTTMTQAPSMGQATVLNNPVQPHPNPAASARTVMTASSGVATGSITLVALDGPIVGQRFAITQSVEIGREVGAIQLPFDPGTSRRHAMINFGMQGAEITDLGSTNGTFVNGQRIQQSVIRAGDVVKIGSTSFRIEG